MQISTDTIKKKKNIWDFHSLSHFQTKITKNVKKCFKLVLKNGATTFYITTLGIIALGIITNILTLSITKFSKMSQSIKTISTIILSILKVTAILCYYAEGNYSDWDNAESLYASEF